jgi:recombinational DNA repair ATPase RecF
MELVRTVERPSKFQSLPTLRTPELTAQLMSILDRQFLSYGKLLDRAREDAKKDIKHRQRNIDREFATINQDTIHLSVLYHAVKHDLDKEQRQKYQEEWLKDAQKIEELSRITGTEIHTLDLEEHGINVLRQAYRESKTHHDYR